MARFERNPAFHSEIEETARFQKGLSAIASRAAREINAQNSRRYHGHAGHASSPGARIVLGDSLWHIIEFGSVNNPPYAPIRRAFGVMGLRLDIRQL
jgi:hypothetical protein